GGVAFGDEAVADLEHRDSAVRVDLAKEARRPRLAFGDVIFAALERNFQKRRGQPHLVAIPRRRIFVEDRLVRHHPTSSTILPTCSPASIRAWAAAASASGKLLSTS